jgi:hypothetical protein
LNAQAWSPVWQAGGRSQASENGFARQFRTGVSLHSHTMHSLESLSFIPRYPPPPLTQAFGIAEKPLNIEPWSGQTLSVSGIALSVQDYPLTGATAELDNSVLEGPRRLASKGREIVPSWSLPRAASAHPVGGRESLGRCDPCAGGPRAPPFPPIEA